MTHPLYGILAESLPDLERRWQVASSNPKCWAQMSLREQTELRALSELVPLLRTLEWEFIRENWPRGVDGA